MLKFFPLERAALDEISRLHPRESTALERQLATAVVSRRRNSGARFFTDLEVDRSAPRIETKERVLGNVAAWIEGFKQPLLLMLFIEDGYALMLEGAVIDDSTLGVDFATVRFEIERSPPA